jgi:hemerythrin
MTKFVWTEQFNLGIEVIDEQHRKIMEYVNQLQDSRARGKPRKEIGKLIDQLVEYIIFHFGFEENLQEKVGYPYLNPHQKTHALIARQISDYKARFDKGEDFPANVDGMLSSWLFDHVKHDDADFVGSVKEKLRLAPDFLTEKKGLLARLFK